MRAPSKVLVIDRRGEVVDELIPLLRASGAAPELARTLGQACARLLMEPFFGVVVDSLDALELGALLDELRPDGLSPSILLLSDGASRGLPEATLVRRRCRLCPRGAISKQKLREWLREPRPMPRRRRASRAPSVRLRSKRPPQ